MTTLEDVPTTVHPKMSGQSRATAVPSLHLNTSTAWSTLQTKDVDRILWTWLQTEYYKVKHSCFSLVIKASLFMDQATLDSFIDEQQLRLSRAYLTWTHALRPFGMIPSEALPNLWEHRQPPDSGPTEAPPTDVKTPVKVDQPQQLLSMIIPTPPKYKNAKPQFQPEARRRLTLRSPPKKKTGSRHTSKEAQSTSRSKQPDAHLTNTRRKKPVIRPYTGPLLQRPTLSSRTPAQPTTTTTETTNPEAPPSCTCSRKTLELFGSCVCNLSPNTSPNSYICDCEPEDKKITIMGDVICNCSSQTAAHPVLINNLPKDNKAAKIKIFALQPDSLADLLAEIDVTSFDDPWDLTPPNSPPPGDQQPEHL